MENKITKSNNINFILIFLILGIIFIISGICLCLFSSNEDKKISKKEILEINYEKENIINLSNVKKGIIYSNKIKVINNTNKDLSYSVSFLNVSNTFNEQNKLLYVLDTHDSGALFVAKSQLPVVAFDLSNDVKIKSKTTHSYIFTVYFEGDVNKEKNSSFVGKIIFKRKEDK